MSCTCNNCNPYYTPCCTTEQDCTCPIKLDFSCLIYNKFNTDLSGLTNLNLPNGTTLKVFAEAVDAKFANSNFVNFTLPILRVDYVVNTLKQFAEAVDTKVGVLDRFLGDLSSDPSSPRDGDMWSRSSGTVLKIRLNGATKTITIS